MSYTKHGHHNIWTSKDDERQPKARQCGGESYLYCHDCDTEINISRSAIETALREAFAKAGYPYALARIMASQSTTEMEGLLQGKLKTLTLN